MDRNPRIDFDGGGGAFFALLYSVDELIDPAITIKAVGHQWYWSYEFSDYATEEGEIINFDSYMLPTEDLDKGQLRLLEVDERVVLPVNTHIRVIVTAGRRIALMGHPIIRGEVGRMSWSFEPDLSVHQASWCILRTM